VKLRTRAAIFSVALASALAASWAISQDGKDSSSRVPKPVHVIAKGDKCVEPIEFMRKNHMEVLLHHRDRTMHQGIRTTQHSLKACVECHANPQTGSVAAGKEDFCQSCHAYAAVKIDCFECHSTRPKAVALGNPR
jgi:hypothetical protein